jgi:predicted Zn-dependent peptidase
LTRQAQIRVFVLCALIVLLGPFLPAQTGELTRGIQLFTLPNGLHLVVAVRPELQLVAVNLTVDLGSIDDPPGMAGIAHLLEHVTLSGSTTVGSRNPEAEARALADLDRAYAALVHEQAKSEPDPGVVAGLQKWFEQAQDSAVHTAEVGEILGGRLEARGAIGLNATTTADATQFFASVPASELELWFSLEAERLQRPIFRRFYLERNVVLREVLTLTGGRLTPQERLLQELFPGTPVAQPLAGDMNQIRSIGRPAALAYFHQYYRPENIAIAVVGNVDPEEVHRLCLRYLGEWRPEGPASPQRYKRERPAPQAAPFIRTFNSPQGPAVFFAVPQPAGKAARSAAIQALAEMINSEDVSPLNRELVQREAVAWQVGAAANYPAQKGTPTFLVHVYGNSGYSSQALIQETSALLQSLRAAPDEDVTAAILAAEMRMAAQLDDPSTLAAQLAFSQAVHGDWAVPFQELETLRRLKADEVRADAQSLFKGLAPRNPVAAERRP